LPRDTFPTIVPLQEDLHVAVERLGRWSGRSSIGMA
jgi:hypothetical protein